MAPFVVGHSIVKNGTPIDKIKMRIDIFVCSVILTQS